MKKKTFKQWQKSNLDMCDFLFEPCIIDEEMYNYIGEVIPPVYCADGIIQGGDCEKVEDGISYYHTVSIEYRFQTYFYLGVLPEFK